MWNSATANRWAPALLSEHALAQTLGRIKCR
jgi:hypothetical protein